MSHSIRMRHDSIEAWRRDDRRLAWVGRLLGFASFAALGSVLLLVFVMEHSDLRLALLSPLGVAAGLGRILVWRVRAVPGPVRRLGHGLGAEADAAWALVEAHRAELLAATWLPASIHDAPLEQLDRAGLAERAKRVSSEDGRRVLRWFLVGWSLAALAVILTLTLQELAPPIVFRGL
jgi:hypothetical protein